ncbi:MAG: flavodoxin family protein [Anaerovoracaceae bacterium]|jgi:flavodoxin
MERQKTAVRYYSRSGNTAKIATAIAEECGCRAKKIPQPLTEPVDLLFLGAALYGGRLDAEVTTFLQSLEKDKVGRVAVFATSAISKKVYQLVCAELEGSGIETAADNFYCHGKFAFLHIGHPSEADEQAARDFARRVRQDA